jgi:hypothetical protein
LRQLQLPSFSNPTGLDHPPIKKILDHTDGMNLFCLYLGARSSTFRVGTSPDATIYDLKIAIKRVMPNASAHNADQLELFLAKRGGVWLLDDDNRDEVDDLLIQPLRDTAPVGQVFQDPTIDTIHVLVRERLEGRLAGVPNKRLRRWGQLNRELLKLMEKSNDADTGNKNKRVKTSLPYSSLKWDALEDIYEPRFDYGYQISYFRIPNEDLDLLETIFKKKLAVYDQGSNNKEAKRSFFIEPIFLVVAGSFVPPVQIEIEEQVDGKHVNANGNLDFVLKRKMESGRYKRICVVEAKKEDMNKGKAQNLVAMEVVSKLEKKETVYCIVTNFKKWIFMQLSDDKIGIHEDQLDLGKGIRNEVGRIAAKLLAILDCKD